MRRRMVAPSMVDSPGSRKVVSCGGLCQSVAASRASNSLGGVVIMSSLIRVRGGPIVRVFPHNWNWRYLVPGAGKGSVPPIEPPAEGGDLTIGNSGTQWGYRVTNGIGAIAPDPFSVVGTNGAVVNGIYADTSTNNMRLTFESGASIGTYTFVIDGQPAVFFYTPTGGSTLTTFASGLVAYLAARGGQVLPFTLTWAPGLPPLVATVDAIGGTDGAGGNGVRGNSVFFGSWVPPLWETAGTADRTITGLYTDPAVADTCRLVFSNTVGGSPIYYMEFDGEAAVTWPAISGNNSSIVSAYLAGKLAGVAAGVSFQLKFYSVIS